LGGINELNENNCQLPTQHLLPTLPLGLLIYG
jgi:hypothetical protein